MSSERDGWSESKVHEWTKKETVLRMQLVDILFTYYSYSHFHPAESDDEDKTASPFITKDSLKWVASKSGIPYDEETGEIKINQATGADIIRLEQMHAELIRKLEKEEAPNNLFTAAARLDYEAALKNKLESTASEESEVELFQKRYSEAWTNIGYHLGSQAVYILLCIFCTNEKSSEISTRALKIIHENIAGYRISHRLYHAFYRGDSDSEKNTPLSLGEINVAKLYGLEYVKMKKEISDYNVLEYYLQPRAIDDVSESVEKAIKQYMKSDQDLIDYNEWTSLYEYYGLYPLYVIIARKYVQQ